MKAGFDVRLISSKAPYGDFLRQEHRFDLTEIEIPRNISPLKDLVAIWKLYRNFRQNQYDIVHSGSPKPGLLVAIAGFLARVPVRLHTFTGQRWATLHGPLKLLLKKLDQLVIRLNTRCYADSPSQIEFLIQERIATPGALHCLHEGSYGGIDISHFRKGKFPEARAELAERLNWPLEIPWILFVGRITYDKGLQELIEAFNLCTKTTDARLLLLGDLESLVPERDSTWQKNLQDNEKIRQIPFQTNPEFYMAACDFLCLPSHREGFGTVVIEAAASGICALGSDIPGLRDSIVDKQTGILVPVGNPQALAQAMVSLCTDVDLRRKLAANAFARANKDFDFHVIAAEQMKEYDQLLAEKNIKR